MRACADGLYLSVGKKLKRRLEDLERRASDESPEPGKASDSDSVKPTKRQSASAKSQKTRRPSPHTQTKSQHQHDEYLFMPLHDAREESHIPPLYSSLSAYTPPSDASMSPYGHMQPFMPMTTLDPCPTFLPTTAATILPPVSRVADDSKGVYYGDSFTSGLNYGFVSGISIEPSHHYDTVSPHVS